MGAVSRERALGVASHVEPRGYGQKYKLAESPDKRRGMTAAYTALILFSGLYFFHPLDFVPRLAIIPLGKITAGIALLTLVFGLVSRPNAFRLPKDMWLLLLFFGQLCLTVPFAYWRGGSFKVVFQEFSKTVVVAIMVCVVVNSWERLRKLIWVQASAVALMAGLAILLRQNVDGRLQVGQSIYGNPNDLAFAIAFTVPLCLAFLLATRNPLKKILWAAGLAAMFSALLLTYSRSGFLATTLGVVLCLLEFGVRGRRVHLLFLAAIGGMALLLVVPANYGKRLESIVNHRIDPTDRGSAEARKQLLIKSLEVLAKHPLLGVGPGNFIVRSGSWHVAHNTYTEVASEAGIPGLLLFLLLIRCAFSNLRPVRRLSAPDANGELRLFAGALWASLGAYLLGAFFCDSGFALFLYLLLAYTAVLYRLAQASQGAGEVNAGTNGRFLARRKQVNRSTALPKVAETH